MSDAHGSGRSIFVTTPFIQFMIRLLKIDELNSYVLQKHCTSSMNVCYTLFIMTWDEKAFGTMDSKMLECWSQAHFIDSIEGNLPSFWKKFFKTFWIDLLLWTKRGSITTISKLKSNPKSWSILILKNSLFKNRLVRFLFQFSGRNMVLFW